ncbi:MAG: response regulator [Cytophagales bacterium]
MIKLLIVDDHQVVRKGVSTLLENEPDIEIVGEAADGFEAIEKIKLLNPNVVLLDISMPKMNGIETAELIQKNHKTVRSLIFSMHNNEDYIVKSVKSGAFGYILKDTTKVEMLNALRSVANGEKYFNPEISNILLESLLQNSNKEDFTKSEGYKISKKEKLVLKNIVNGLNSREIAEKLTLSTRTVDNHRAHIMKKLGVKNAIELVKLSLKENLA